MRSSAPACAGDGGLSRHAALAWERTPPFARATSSPTPRAQSSVSGLPDSSSGAPRHFGVTFREVEDFEALHRLCLQRKIEMYSDVNVRFEGLVEVHRTFVLRDPSDNLVE